MSVKYVKDFEFPSDFGFKGSANTKTTAVAAKGGHVDDGTYVSRKARGGRSKRRFAEGGEAGPGHNDSEYGMTAEERTNFDALKSSPKGFTDDEARQIATNPSNRLPPLGNAVVRSNKQHSLGHDFGEGPQTMQYIGNGKYVNRTTGEVFDGTAPTTSPDHMARGGKVQHHAMGGPQFGPLTSPQGGAIPVDRPVIMGGGDPRGPDMDGRGRWGDRDGGRQHFQPGGPGGPNTHFPLNPGAGPTQGPFPPQPGGGTVMQNPPTLPAPSGVMPMQGLAKGGKFIQGMHLKKGALHRELGVPESEKIPESKMRAAASGRYGPLAEKRAHTAETLKGLGKKRK